MPQIDPETEKLVRVRLARAIREFAELVGARVAHRDFCDLAQAAWNHRAGEDEELDLTMISERRR